MDLLPGFQPGFQKMVCDVLRGRDPVDVVGVAAPHTTLQNKQARV